MAGAPAIHCFGLADQIVGRLTRRPGGRRANTCLQTKLRVGKRVSFAGRSLTTMPSGDNQLLIVSTSGFGNKEPGCQGPTADLNQGERDETT